MATAKPRISITFTQRQYDVLKSISDMGGRPMSALISELVEECLPTLERMAATFQALNRAHASEREKIVSALDRAQAAIEPVVMNTVGQFDIFLGQIEDAAEPEGRRTDAGAGGADPTPVRPPRAVRKSPRPVITGATKAKRKVTKGGKQGAV